MIERLALPAWSTPPRPLDDWTGRLAATGQKVTVDRESPGSAWVEVAALRLRGYAVIEGGHVAAINFELHDLDPTAARDLIEAAARDLGWEVHDEEDEPDDIED